ncbi:MAG TPA: HPF/RaiA family ribosome-associated protein [Candidatus Binataceae bacterium]|nr:HPF/RaiA family ribosome-associated protein [Candidatus Binataceae bacterium]
MQRQLQITARDFVITEAIELQVRERARALESYFDRLTGCRVVLEAPAVHHHRKGGPFNVRIDLRVPGNELSVNRQNAEDLSIAVRDAFDAARRVLEDYVRELRHDVKTHEHPLAKIARVFIEEGYGFIETADGREVYFHRNSVLGNRFEHLKPGVAVRYAEEMGENGPQASTIAVVGGKRQPA